jgi:hypothetical protein
VSGGVCKDPWVCLKRCSRGEINWSYGVMVSTLDFESSDPGSSPGRTYILRIICVLWVAWLRVYGYVACFCVCCRVCVCSEDDWR